jgi:hypothetical protein
MPARRIASVTRRLTLLVVTVVALVCVGLSAGGPAAAQPDEVAGGAFALSLASGSTFLLAPTPGGVDAGGTGQFTPLATSQPLVGVPGLASAVSLEASTDGRPGPGGAASVTSTASAEGVSLAAGLVRIGTVSSSCTSTTDGATATSVIDALTVAGAAIPVATGPNTAVDVPGLVHGVLNEQVADGASGVTVRALHVQVHLGNGGPQLLDVVVAESRCLVTPSGPGAPSSTVVPLPTTRPTVPPRPATTTPSGPPVSATVTAPGPGAGPGPAPGPGPGGSGAGPAPGPLSVRVTAPGAAGEPGESLDIAATGFAGCSTVRLLFDDGRIGTARPDPAGAATARGLSVPGGAGTGRHVVAATCQVDGRVLRATAVFQVEEASVHRSAFVTALALPRQVGTSARSLLISVVAALGLLLAIAFPSELFNSTLDENYDEVRGWFGLHRESADARSPLRQAVEFAGFVLLGGVLYGFLSPDLGFDRSSLALVLGLSLSLVVISVGFRLPHLVYIRRRDHEWARFRVLPGTALVAVACVGLSRLVHFQPGYLYGLIAGLSFRRRLETDTNGALTAASAVSVFVLSIAAWVARVPVAGAAARPNASIWIVALEACLAAISILGLETVVICLIPVRFVEGSKLAAWSRTAWALVFGLCAFAFVHILLRPDSGYVAASSSRWTVLVLFLGFGLLSVGFWAYFRFRPARTAAVA